MFWVFFSSSFQKHVNMANHVNNLSLNDCRQCDILHTVRVTSQYLFLFFLYSYFVLDSLQFTPTAMFKCGDSVLQVTNFLGK